VYWFYKPADIKNRTGQMIEVGASVTEATKGDLPLTAYDVVDELEAAPTSPPVANASNVTPEKADGTSGSSDVPETIAEARGQPPATEPLARPPQHRFGLHDHQGGAPLAPSFGEEDPKESLPPVEPRARDRSGHRGQLLSARFSSATARCPRQMSPIDRRSTSRAVSIRDPFAHAITKSTVGTGGRVLANHRLRHALSHLGSHRGSHSDRRKH
jgi:hypothetical protein